MSASGTIRKEPLTSRSILSSLDANQVNPSTVFETQDRSSEVREYVRQRIAKHSHVGEAIFEVAEDCLAAIEFALECQTELHKALKQISAGYIRRAPEAE